MSTFNLEKMVGTIDKLSTSLDVMLCCKDSEGGQEILETCEQLDSLIMSFDDQISILKDALIKEKNARQSSFQRQLDELKTIEERCNHMIVYIQLNTELETQQYTQSHEIKEYKGNNSNNMANISMSPVPKWKDGHSLSENTIHHTTISNGTIMSNSMMGQSLKSQAAKQVLDIPLLKSVNNDEMDSVPKYMKGRLTSLNVNVVIDGINIALENKYEILQKPRNLLKKKDQDIYNTWKIQQNDVGQGQYFVTADDISRFGETKVDKTTLNIIPILRHLKRLKESRTGGFVYYLPY
ncbi:spindle and kinetochore-associated protein 1-like [Metopolophium dirhodum]|uniref:spindle and kinetochore-associated protein 1-like n=1 Tax=Metopolophium dirhodum TaxID=44670 RepID=UPI00298F47D0|nr:spindle and kinetochore-associated protein 1-like [Metopolophium dirhodum]XP_060877027.1 spindle and kinetochore-associated protein 1-like [Metopolophium dirhodum]